ncbi:MAG: hydroxymethylbilane synthase [Candidatus Rokubacteria bacterium]|nr:hydroxymethylbilane synthase [Candidatus Rokubacteria bacterium]
MIRIGTRASRLALAQAGTIADGLRRAGAEVEIVPMKTEGDRRLGARLADVGGKGLFVREIEEALLAEHVDVAVHSLKDLPAELPAGLELAAFPPREDARDVLITRAGGGLEDLPAAAVLGTSSLRRQALALALRPDLVVEPVRGNVDTRLAKLETGGVHALLLAAAGLARLGLSPRHARPLAPDVFVPAVGQGILGIEVRSADAATRRAVAALDDADTRACALAERAFLARLGASCNTPMAGHATIAGGDERRLSMTAVVASEDGRQVLRAEAAGRATDAAALGESLARSLLDRGAATVTTLHPERSRR